MFKFNDAEYKVVARTTNDFGEIAINDKGEWLFVNSPTTQQVSLLTSKHLIRVKQPYSSREISHNFLKPFSIQLQCGGIEYIMTEEEKEDYLCEYVDAFIEALYNNSGEH